jgi:hypothetical protein
MRIFSLGCLFLLGIFVSPIFAQKKSKHAESKPFASQLEEIKKQVAGLYEMRVTDPNAPASAKIPQDMLVFPIWKVENEQWFYFAWINTSLKERPMEEAFWRIYQDPNQAGRILCDFHRIPDRTNYQYEWRKNKPYSNLNHDAIADMPHCAGELKILSDGVLQGLTFEPCPREESNKGGGYVATAVDFKFHKTFLTMGNAHVDKNGNPVIKFDHSIQLKKSTKSFSKY